MPTLTYADDQLAARAADWRHDLLIAARKAGGAELAAVFAGGELELNDAGEWGLDVMGCWVPWRTTFADAIDRIARHVARSGVDEWHRGPTALAKLVLWLATRDDCNDADQRINNAEYAIAKPHKHTSLYVVMAWQQS